MSEDNSKNDLFERFFQKKADEYEIFYNEADWKDLENRLDILDEKRAIAKKRFLAGAAVFLLFSLLGYFTLNNYMTINRLEQQLESQQAQPQKSETNAEHLRGNSAVGDTHLGDTIIRSDKENEEASTASPAHSKEIVRLSQNEENTEFIAATGLTENISIDELQTANYPLSNFAEWNEAIVSDSDIEPVLTKNGQPLLAALAVKPPSSAVAANENRPPASSAFSVGLAMAPDFSTVGSLSNFYSPGYKIGAYIEYKVAPNFGISAGVIHSTVRYTAGKGEYHVPYGYWTNGIAPYETLAECVLIDIPITFKYDFMRFDRSRIYATAGISSYIMLNEEYQFEYYEADEGLVQNWNSKTRTRHWASNAGFSIGFEYDINQTLSIRAEPFIRVPLREVGWGNVRLYSTGTFISLNYKFH